jgi:hypothetical protein
MRLYHASAYRADLLRPSFKHTKHLERWDVTESNHWLYASTDEDEAILNGLAGAIGLRVQVDRVQFDEHNYKVYTADALTPEMIRGCVVYLYNITASPSDGWVRVNNAHNHSTTEWKTMRDIVPESMRIVSDPIGKRQITIVHTGPPAALIW